MRSGRWAGILGVLAMGSVATNAAADPPPASVDGSLPAPYWADLRGANEGQAWISMATRDDARPKFEAVFDLKTGCLVETWSVFARLDELDRMAHLTGAERMKDPAAAGATRARRAEALMATPPVLTELSAFMALSNRFGRTAQDNAAWSADGRTVLVTASETAFRSRDGGKTFQRLDTNMSRSPHVTRDGRWAMYERCAADVRDYSCPPASREIAIVATDDAVPPRRVPLGGALIEGMDAAGETLVVVRDDVPRKITAMHVDPALGAMTQAFAADAPPLPKNVFFTIDPSPGGHYGVFDFWRGWETTNRVLSMADGHTVYSFDAHLAPTTVLDEDGRVAWQTLPDHRIHTRVGKTSGARDLGKGDELLGFAPGGKLLVFAEPTTGNVGRNVCKMLRVIPVPL